MGAKKHYLRTTKNLYYIDESQNLRVYYSYTTPVALMIDGDLKVSENCWSVTTGKHLTWIDGGMKKSRLKKEDFQKLLDKYKPESKAPDFLKTVGTMSALFGLMSKGEDKKKVNNQKKRFFDHVNGLQFPDDWETLTEEEKEKRLNKVEQVALTN